MKLCNIKNIDDFFKIVNKCKGTVELVSKDMKLNLKSQLAKYFAIAKLVSDGTDIINEIEISCSNADDAQLFIEYMMNGGLYE